MNNDKEVNAEPTTPTETTSGQGRRGLRSWSAPSSCSCAPAPDSFEKRKLAHFDVMLTALQALLPEGWDDGTMDHMPGVLVARCALAIADEIVADENKPANALTGARPTSNPTARQPEPFQTAVVAAGHDGPSLGQRANRKPLS